MFTIYFSDDTTQRTATFDGEEWSLQPNDDMGQMLTMTFDSFFHLRNYSPSQGSPLMAVSSRAQQWLKQHNFQVTQVDMPPLKAAPPGVVY